MTRFHVLRNLNSEDVGVDGESHLLLHVFNLLLFTFNRPFHVGHALLLHELDVLPRARLLRQPPFCLRQTPPQGLVVLLVVLV